MSVVEQDKPRHPACQESCAWQRDGAVMEHGCQAYCLSQRDVLVGHSVDQETGMPR